MPGAVAGRRSGRHDGTGPTGDGGTALEYDPRDGARVRQRAEYVAGLPGAGRIEATILYAFPDRDYRGAPAHGFDEIDAAVAAAEYLEARFEPAAPTAVGGGRWLGSVAPASDVDADGVVVPGRKRSSLQQVLMGSTTADVVRSVERPVTPTG